MFDRQMAIVSLAIFAAILAGASSAAFAHAIVTSSIPAANASVPAGDVRIVLTFNSRIDKKRSRIAVLFPDARETPVPITADDSENVLQGVATLNQAGAYQIRWQVLSRDGHITRGLIPFSVQPTPPER